MQSSVMMRTSAPSSAFATRATHSAAPSVGVRPAGFATPLLRPHKLRVRPLRFKENDEQERIITSSQERELRERTQEVKDSLKEGTPGSLSDVYRAVQGAGTDSQIYTEDGPQVSPFVPAFTRRREIWAGRIAMVGFFASTVWEVLLPFHPGPIGQVSYLTGFPPATVFTGLVGLILFNAVSGLAPWSPTFAADNLRDVNKRPVGPPFNLVNPFNLKASLGISNWGFTKRNELFNGRMAMLGFLAAVTQEVRLGGVGPVGQLARFLGTPADDAFYSMPTVFVGFAMLAVSLAALNGNFGLQAWGKEEDIY